MASLTVDSLPNEILLSTLSSLSTRDLLPLVQVSRRFYAIVLRILHYRLLYAAALPEHRLVLECCHPSVKMTCPLLYCDFLRTDELSCLNPTLTDLNELYTHFRPARQEERRQRRRFIGPMVPQQQQAMQEAEDPQGLTPHNVFLDESELFSQLCTSTNLVKVGPKQGLYLSNVNVSDGVVRVWRNWLAAHTNLGEEKDTILWTDTNHNVGLRFSVVKTEVEHFQMQRRPLFGGPPDDDLPVSYRLEYRELVVRSSRLLMTVEKSQAQEGKVQGKAIIFAI